MANHRGGSGNFAEDRERASEAGRKGGQHSGGNFKNDPQRASEAGKKGVKTVMVVVKVTRDSHCSL
ncbi:Conidiation-specific protein 10 [Klebsiella pneumoniae ISC21]|nr:Conidiation-specific protein 10 [Klebsiella pneumoniae ISC21]